MDRFINRNRELETLEAEYQRSGASFVVIYGRRRIGKTALIRHFCQDKDNIFFLASEEDENENRKNLQQIIAEHTHNELLSSVDVVRWDLIFSTLADYMKQNTSGGKLILAIDEFQYIGKANPSFPSILMKIWDMILKDCNIMLILCGSLINMMRTQVLSYDSPLYGRRTAQIHFHVSFVYEEICRQHVWNYLSDDLYFDRVGRWWGNKNVEIDIVAYDSTGTTILFGECKYSRNPKGIDILWNLKEKSASVNWKRNERIEHFAIF